MPAKVERQLAALFQATGTAHHQAFSATDGEDPDWPAWYAAYLAPRLADLLSRTVDEAQLAIDLQAVDHEYQTMGRGSWPEYYTRWFLKRWRSDA
jgi:hypothetical protein